MYLCLIWIRVLKHVFQNPEEAAKHLKDNPFFKKFVARPSTEVYIEGLCNSLQSLCIGSPVKRPSVKRRLMDMVSDSSDDKDERLFLPKFPGTPSLKMMLFLQRQYCLLMLQRDHHLLKRRVKNRRKQKSISSNIVVNTFLISSVYFV